MKLNIKMILDSLDMPITHIVGDQGNHLKLHDVYHYTPERSCNDAGVIYLGNWDDFRLAKKLPKHVICIGGGEEAMAFFTDNNSCGLILARGQAEMLIHRDIQEVFSKYNMLERKLLNSILENKPILDILNACSAFFEAHITLFSSDFNLLGYSDTYLPPEDDALWQATLKNKRSAITTPPLKKVLLPLGSEEDTPRSVYIESDNVPHHLNVGFYYGDSRVATMIVSERNTRLSEHDEWLLDYIVDIMYPTILERFNTFYDMRNYFRTTVSSVLRYANMDTTLLQNNLARLGWQENDDYQILLVKLPPEHQKASRLLFDYENIFFESYSDCIALHHDEYIMILLHGKACDELAQNIPALKRQLSIDNAAVSVGLRFCYFTSLKVQYDLTTLPFKVTIKPKKVNIYMEHMETHLIHELSTCFPIRATCHNAAVRINEYDNQNGTDFLLVLETYLMNNRSLISASEKLYIHRSTLTYRLKCIEKIAPMNLDDPCQRLHILLSCIALRILSRNENTPD